MPLLSRRMYRGDHDILAKNGKTVSSEAVSLRFGPQKTLENKAISATKTACVVSGKVAPHAVDRNLLKRRGRAILQGLEKSLVPGYLCAFIFKKPAISSSFEKLETEIESLLAKAYLLN